MQLAWRTRLAATGPSTDEPATIPPHDMVPGELAIVEQAKSDPRAFAPLYERYAPIVYHYCLRRLSHPEAAADATAIVFTKAIAALPRFTADRNRQVRAMLERLPDRQRAIVELRLAGLSGAEIGRTLGMSESAVKSAQFRAYGILRELFRDHDLAPDHLEPPR